MDDETQGRPYTDGQVSELRLDAKRIAEVLMFSRDEGDRWWLLAEGDPEVMEALIYDALTALRSEMAEEDV
jgi:hypothetical protein